MSLISSLSKLPCVESLSTIAGQVEKKVLDNLVETQFAKKAANLKPKIGLDLMTQGVPLPKQCKPSVFDEMVGARSDSLFFMNLFKTKKAEMAAKQALENLNG